MGARVAAGMLGVVGEGKGGVGVDDEVVCSVDGVGEFGAGG